MADPSVFKHENDLDVRARIDGTTLSGEHVFIMETRRKLQQKLQVQINGKLKETGDTANTWRCQSRDLYVDSIGR